MSEPPSTPEGVIDPNARPRRVQRLAAGARRYRRLFAASTTLVVLLGLVLLGYVWRDHPEPTTLGVGMAGVMDSTVLADTLNPDTSTALPYEAANDEQVDSLLPEGPASYYGDELAGHPTASGERFDPEQLTAAHRTLPFGTRLRVTNIRNGVSVIVRVNDRGPFSGNRVLDLSASAARKIGILRRGEARVRMEVLK